MATDYASLVVQMAADITGLERQMVAAYQTVVRTIGQIEGQDLSLNVNTRGVEDAIASLRNLAEEKDRLSKHLRDLKADLTLGAVEIPFRFDEKSGAWRDVTTGRFAGQEKVTEAVAQATAGLRQEIAATERQVVALDRAMARLGSASPFARLAHEANQAQSRIREAEQSLDGLRRTAESVSGLGRTLMIGVTAPVLALGGFAVTAAAEMDQLRRGLTAVTGSAEEAERQLVRLEQVAKLPGLSFREAVRGAISLQAAGISAGLAERALRGFGNALATVGRGSADLEGVIRALTQISSKTRISAEEINQLAERIPQIRVLLTQAFGTADTEAIQRLGIKPAEFLERLVAQLEKLPPATAGASTAFENFADAVRLARAAIGEQLLPVVIPLTDALTGFLLALRDVDPAIIRFGIALAGVGALAGPALLAIGQLSTAFIALRVAGFGLGAVLGPGAALLVGIAGLAALFAKAKLDALEAAGATERFKQSLQGLGQSATLSALVAAQVKTEQLRTELQQLERQAAQQQSRKRVVHQRGERVEIPGAVDRQTRQRIDEVTQALNEQKAQVESLGRQYQTLSQASQTADTPIIIPIDAKEAASALRAAQDILDKSTTTMVDDLQRNLARLETEWAATFRGRLPAELRAALDVMRREIAAARLLEPFERELETGERKIEFDLRLKNAEGALQGLEALDQQIRKLEGEAAAFVVGSTERERLNDKIRDAIALYERLLGLTIDLGQQEHQAAAEAAQRSQQQAQLEIDALERQSRAFYDRARAIDLAARGAVQLAEAFRLVDDAVSRTIQNIAQLVSGVVSIQGALKKLEAARAAVAAADRAQRAARTPAQQVEAAQQAGRAASELAAANFEKFAGIMGAVGAGISLLTSTLGGLFGEDPAEVERLQIERHNSQTLEQIRAGVYRFGDLLRGVAGVDVRGIQAAAAAGIAAGEEARRRTDGLGRGLAGNLISAAVFNRELMKLGLTMDEAKRIAQGYGITLDGTLDSLRKLDAAMRETALQDLFRSVSGQLDLLQRQFDLFDITEPQDQIKHLLARLLEFSNLSIPDRARLLNLFRLDFSTEEAQAQLDAAMRELFTRFRQGTIGFEQLGQLSPEQFLDLISQIEGLGDSFNDLKDKTDRVVEGITNLPAGYKALLDLRRYEAARPRQLEQGMEIGDLPTWEPIRIDVPDLSEPARQASEAERRTRETIERLFRPGAFVVATEPLEEVLEGSLALQADALIRAGDQMAAQVAALQPILRASIEQQTAALSAVLAASRSNVSPAAVAIAAESGPTVVHVTDRRNITIQVTQQPGENVNELAERIRDKFADEEYKHTGSALLGWAGR